MWPFSGEKTSSPPRNNQLNIWRILFITFFTIVLLLWINQFLEKMVIYWKTCERIEQFIREEERLQQEIAAMKKEKEYLHQDWYIEKLARERLNLVKPGEIVVELVPSQNP
ncbi:hypothetical protein M15_21360 [Atrimonas thermophila]